MQGASKPQMAAWLEGALRRPLKFTHTGYAPNRHGPLWEFLTTGWAQRELASDSGIGVQKRMALPLIS
jgi:hypothetical protein